MVARICEMDPVGGDWCVNDHEMRVWMSSVTMRVVLEGNGNIIKDATWMHPAGDAKHGNLAEFDAMIKDINMAFQWQVSLLYLFMDSVCVHHWISRILISKACINMKVSDEMLIWWLETLAC